MPDAAAERVQTKVVKPVEIVGVDSEVLDGQPIREHLKKVAERAFEGFEDFSMPGPTMSEQKRRARRIRQRLLRRRR